LDKLRSLHYFVAAAEASSFSAAARRFGVSTAAVAKLIQSLERELDLLARDALGLRRHATRFSRTRSQQDQQ